MGVFIGMVLGSLLWLWVFAAVLRVFGATRGASIWSGYALMLVAATIIRDATEYAWSGLATFAAFGLLWAFLLARRTETSSPPSNDENAGDASDSPIPHGPQTSTPARRVQKKATSPTCRACGRRNDADASFCNGCGGALSAPCEECKTRNAPDAVFCKRCGARLARREGSAAGERSVPAAAETTARSPFPCFECGSKVRFGASHCRSCGLAFTYDGDTVARSE